MIKIDREKSIAIIEIHGIPKVSDIQQTIEALLKNPDHLDGMDEIWDFRDASLKFIAEKATLPRNGGSIRVVGIVARQLH